MKVQFYIDPICPFCWQTSRWLVKVAPHRDLEIDWQPISLFFKNDPSPDSEYYEPTLRSLGLLRLLEAARNAGLADRIGDLYTEFGRHIHNRQDLDFDVVAVLTELGLDASLADALEDESLDSQVRSAMDAGLALVGDDVGTPIIVTESGGREVGLFGPVITKMPTLEDSLRLWDGYATMVSIDGFFELKRTRMDLPTFPPESEL